MSRRQQRERQERMALDNPPKLSIDAALKSDDPATEVAIRLPGLPELSTSQRTFEGLFYFFASTLGGGIETALSSDIGRFFSEVETFAANYCSPAMAAVFEEVKSLFPGATVPVDFDSREKLVWSLTDGFEKDPFDNATSKFYALEDEFRQGLVAYLTDNKEDFDNLIEAGE